MSMAIRRAPLIRAGIVLGIGLGGFFDGIVFHQLLQWHHMLSSEFDVRTMDGLQLNILADGLFHATTYVITGVGLVLLFRATPLPDSSRSTRLLLGSILAGFGAFNLIEGLINHQILGIHHVRPGPNELAYDLAFLVVGAILVLIGVWLIRDERDTQRGS
jgi:uncharacterized membrane protein